MIWPYNVKKKHKDIPKYIIIYKKFFVQLRVNFTTNIYKDIPSKQQINTEVRVVF